MPNTYKKDNIGTTAINEVVLPKKIAHAFTELRCTFGGYSLVPDIAVFSCNRIPKTEKGRIANKFELYPDFPTAGMIEVSRYNDGLRGGAVKVRARIEKVDNKTLKISEIPQNPWKKSIDSRPRMIL